MNIYNVGNPIQILLVEDNPDDIDLTREALKEAKVLINLTAIEDGAAALSFLQQPVTVRPDLILLDLNLPKLSGQELLAEIKADPKLRHIPVVVLTTSGAREDIFTAYQRYANAYITKPVDLDQFLKVIQVVEDFWLTVVRLPRQE
jgi:CheY-like chemotaxis protein